MNHLCSSQSMKAADAVFMPVFPFECNGLFIYFTSTMFPIFHERSKNAFVGEYQRK
jgi:hypothetical protein